MSRLQSHATATQELGADLEIAMPPKGDDLTQDEEWVVVNTADGWRKVRLHDYHEVFTIPGLYERWVYQVLGCQSPAKVRDLLARALELAGENTSTLSVLDLGAGNGCVAEELSHIGIESFVGVDIHQEAREAAERDRPGLYRAYVIGDLTNLKTDESLRLDAHRFNCMTCVAALGFGDIPIEVFAAAFNRVDDAGWAAFNVKVDFLDESDTSGFSRLIRAMLAGGQLELAAQETYQHRLSTDGDPLEYTAFIGRKRGNITTEQLRQAGG